jgi:hypothetical protein
MTVPMGVPSGCKISKMRSRIAVRATSAIACPGVGVGLVETTRDLPAYKPLAG